MHVHVHVLMVHAVIPIFGTTTVIVVIDSVVSGIHTNYCIILCVPL